MGAIVGKFRGSFFEGINFVVTEARKKEIGALGPSGQGMEQHGRTAKSKAELSGLREFQIAQGTAFNYFGGGFLEETFKGLFGMP